MKYWVYGAIFATTHVSSFAVGYFLRGVFSLNNVWRFFSSNKKSRSGVTWGEPKDEKKIKSSVDTVFEEAYGEEEKYKNLEDESILDIGLNKKPSQDIGGMALSSEGNMSGYVTSEKLATIYENYEKSSLTQKETKILQTWWNNRIANEKYDEILEYVRSKGYDIHISKVNNGRSLMNRVYDPTLVDVAIKDNEYNYSRRRPSPNAKIKKVIGMGGQTNI